jgi:hypothetical protein
VTVIVVPVVLVSLRPDEEPVDCPPFPHPVRKLTAIAPVNVYRIIDQALRCSFNPEGGASEIPVTADQQRHAASRMRTRL